MADDQQAAMPKPGSFCWDELFSTDIAKSTEYLEKVFGWTHDEMPMPEGNYHLFKSGEEMVGGGMTMPPQMAEQNVPAHWASYIMVDDVDAYTEKATGLGAEVVMPPTDIPGIGRFSFIKDPQGAVVALFKGSQEMPS